jgi:hypothetical protein
MLVCRDGGKTKEQVLQKRGDKNNPIPSLKILPFQVACISIIPGERAALWVWRTPSCHNAMS